MNESFNEKTFQIPSPKETNQIKTLMDFTGKNFEEKKKVLAQYYTQQPTKDDELIAFIADNHNKTFIENVYTKTLFGLKNLYGEKTVNDILHASLGKGATSPKREVKKTAETFKSTEITKNKKERRLPTNFLYTIKKGTEIRNKNIREAIRKALIAKGEENTTLKAYTVTKIEKRERNGKPVTLISFTLNKDGAEIQRSLRLENFIDSLNQTTVKPEKEGTTEKHQKKKEKSPQQNRAEKFKDIRNILEKEGIDVILIHGDKKTGTLGEGLNENERHLLGIIKGETAPKLNRDADTAGAQEMLSYLPLKWKSGSHVQFVERGFKMNPKDDQWKGKNVLTLDTGGDQYGVMLSKQNEGNIIAIDHHQPYKIPHQVSTTELAYRLVNDFGGFEKLSEQEKAKLKSFAEFISEIDDLNYPFELPRDLHTWWKTGYAWQEDISEHRAHNSTGIPPYQTLELMESYDIRNALPDNVLQEYLVGTRSPHGDVIPFSEKEMRQKMQNSPEFQKEKEGRQAIIHGIKNQLTAIRNIAESERTAEEKKRLKELQSMYHKMNLSFSEKPGSFVTLWDIAKKREKDLKDSYLSKIPNIEKIQAKNNLVNETPLLGKILVNKYKGGDNLPLRYNAVRAAGYDSMLQFFTNPQEDYKTTGFFLSMGEKADFKQTLKTLRDIFPDIMPIRGKMLLLNTPDNQAIDPEQVIEALQLKNTETETSPETNEKGDGKETVNNENTSPETTINNIEGFIENLHVGDRFIFKGSKVVVHNVVHNIENGIVQLQYESGQMRSMLHELLIDLAKEDDTVIELL